MSGMIACSAPAGGPGQKSVTFSVEGKAKTGALLQALFGASDRLWMAFFARAATRDGANDRKLALGVVRVWMSAVTLFGHRLSIPIGQFTPISLQSASIDGSMR